VIRRGFTLLEVLLALGILVALLAVMSRFTWSLGQGQQRVLDRLDRQAAIDAVIDRMAIALDTGAASVAGEAGFSGDETTVHLFASQDRPADSLEAALGSRRSLDIRFDQEQHTVRIGGGEPLPIGDLRFRFHDGQQWQDSFDSLDAGALPAAVLLEAWLQDSLIDPSEADLPPDRRRVLTVAGIWRQAP
jgi:prepilin-type N-terminal cleavage/methylation domain-containing protein